MINSINFSYSLSERVFLELVLSEIKDDFIRDYARKLINESKIKKRKYSDYGMYIYFDNIHKEISNNIKKIPILLSAGFEFDFLDNYASFMLYLTEDRRSLNFFEISTCLTGFNEEIMALAILEHLLSKNK